MGTEYATLIVQILIALGTIGALIPVFYKMRSGREREEATAKKEEATAAESLTGSALAFVERCERRIADLETDVARLEKHLRFWQKGCAQLIRQLVEAGLKPVWDPNGGPDEEDERKEE